MSRKKKSLPKVFSNMTLMPEGIELNYTTVGSSILRDPHIQKKLKPSDIYLLLCLNVASAGKDVVLFGEEVAKTYGITPATFHRSKKRLLDAGFVQYHSHAHTLTEFKLVHPSYDEETVKKMRVEGLAYYTGNTPV